MNDTLVNALEPLHADAYGWALHCCEGAHAEAADVLQNAYLKVIRGKVVWHGLSNLKPWWFGVIRFSAREEQRRRRFRETLPGKILRLDVEPDEALPPRLSNSTRPHGSFAGASRDCRRDSPRCCTSSFIRISPSRKRR